MAVESGSKRKLILALKDKNIFHYSPMDKGTSGIADVIGCSKKGLLLAIELKKNKSNGRLSHPLSALQSKFLRDINRSNGLGYILVELPGGWHWEKIDEVGERFDFDWNTRTLDEFISEIEVL